MLRDWANCPFPGGPALRTAGDRMSGGYEPKPKVYEITWGEGTGYEGLEVTAKGTSTEDFLEIMAMAEGLDPKAPMVRAADTKRVLQRFARRLVSWNVTDAGEPVPADYEHLAALDPELSFAIFSRWCEAVGGVDPTSLNGSNGTGTSPAEQPPGLASASRSLPG
jgi:hypothetical protein